MQLALRHVARPSIRASICLQCQFRLQKRRFADDTKSTSSTSEPKTFSPKDGNGQYPMSSTGPELPSASEGRRSMTSKRLSHLMDNLQSNIFHASQRLNDLTGYSGIEVLKASIKAQEDHLEECQEAVRKARQTYKTTVADRAASQREVTTLLARKDTWTPVDLERFTNLYRSDHGNEQAVQEAATRLAEAERVTEHAANKLNTRILRRYHEEQIWSDKIRRMSTWGTWGLMGVNVLIFLVFQFGFEPWRRRRLVQGFEDKVHVALERENERLAALGRGSVDGQRGSGLDEGRGGDVVASDWRQVGIQADDGNMTDQKSASVSNNLGEASVETRTIFGMPIRDGLGSLRRPSTWRAGMLDLFSDRVVSLRQQDITIVALEGAATGAALVGLFMFMLRTN